MGIGKKGVGRRNAGFVAVLFLLGGWAIGAGLSASIDTDARLLAEAAVPWKRADDGLRWELVRTAQVVKASEAAEESGLRAAKELGKRLGAGEGVEEQGPHGVTWRADAVWELRSGEVRLTLQAGGRPTQITLMAQGESAGPSETAAAVRKVKDKLKEAGLPEPQAMGGGPNTADRLAVQVALKPAAVPEEALRSAADKLSAAEVNRYRDAATISASYRSDKLPQLGMNAAGYGSGNLQAAIHRNSESGDLIFVLGTPVLGGDFMIN